MTADEVIAKTDHIPSSVFQPEQRMWHQVLSPLEGHPVIIEFGTGHGRSAATIGLSCPQGTVYTFDPGIPYINEGQNEEEYEADTRKMISMSGATNVIFERISNLDKEWTTPIDAINIDSDHSYEQTKDEINKWIPLLKKGGHAFFHDYGHPNAPGVKQAIDELIPTKHKMRLEATTPAGPVVQAWFIKE